MKTASQVMTPLDQLVVVDRFLPVHELAKKLIEAHADGALVVDNGALVGVVTEMDLVFQEKQVHLPTMLVFMDAVLNFDFAGRTRKEIDKITGTVVEDIMTSEVITASPNTPVREVATWMVEKHLSLVPVMEAEVPVGAITRHGMLRAMV